MTVDKVETETITDDAFGHTVKATKVVRNFKLPSTMSGVGKDTELVLVHVRAKAGKKYVPLSDGDFRLGTSKDPRKGAVATTMAETEMSDAGYPPFGEVGQGKRGAGWLAFLVEGAGDGPLYLSYKRLAFDEGGHPREDDHRAADPDGLTGARSSRGQGRSAGRARAHRRCGSRCAGTRR